MDKNKVAIATMTWARDAREETLLRESLTLLARQRVPTFVSDGGSSEGFIRFLERFDDFRVFHGGGNGLFPQIRRSLRAAIDSGAKFVLYTEPDKKLFFDARLPEFLSNAPSEENVGVVLASRSPAGFATFPEFQRYTETVVNDLCFEIIGERFDYTYGPFLFNRKLADCLERAGDAIGWGWRPFLFAAARLTGYKIVQSANDYSCPAEQRDETNSERLYRMKQLSESIDGLLESARPTTFSSTP
ncbi:MAG TPA: hypothetical protein VIL74_19310 [Pyrinomonadaceae bacterium]|jgi:hypothetical protein